MEIPGHPEHEKVVQTLEQPRQKIFLKWLKKKLEQLAHTAVLQLKWQMSFPLSDVLFHDLFNNFLSFTLSSSMLLFYPS